MLPSSSVGPSASHTVYARDGRRKLFDLEDDDSLDEAFMKNTSRQPSKKPELQTMQALQKKRELIEENTLASTQRSLNLLRESEQVGASTAADLAEQREKLERTSRHLDDINVSLRTTQRHIDSMKSVFGSLKHYFSRSNPVVTATPPSASGPVSVSTAPASSTSSLYKNEMISNETTFYNDENNKSQFVGTSVQHHIDNNLSIMSDNLKSLKSLALDLGEEIIDQNQLIDEVQYKADQADLKMIRQNVQMNRILGKK